MAVARPWAGTLRYHQQLRDTEFAVDVRTAYGLRDSAAVERSDGYKLGSAIFVMTPFRYNVFVGV